MMYKVLYSEFTKTSATLFQYISVVSLSFLTNFKLNTINFILKRYKMFSDLYN